MKLSVLVSPAKGRANAVTKFHRIPKKTKSDTKMCLDPNGLTCPIIREYVNSPSLEVITHKLNSAEMYSKVNTKYGFLPIYLDYTSSLLTAFNTPYSNY